MGKMNNLSFDEGYREFCINGDETRVIKINPSDTSFIERYREAMNNIEAFMTELENTDGININANGELEDNEYEDKIGEFNKLADLLRDVRIKLNEQIDFIFNAKVSDIVFGKQSPLANISGQYLFARFLNAVAPVIEETFHKDIEASNKRINKYKKQYEKYKKA